VAVFHRNFSQVEELVVCECGADGILINLNVRQQLQQISPGLQITSQADDLVAQIIKTGFELGAVRLWHSDTLRRNPSHVIG
jgi:hypothetical protein